MEHTQSDRPPYPEQTGVDPLRRTSEIRGPAPGGCPSWRPWPRSGPGYGTNMTDQIVLLVLGFALTTVVGGVLGYYYQRRTWDLTATDAVIRGTVSPHVPPTPPVYS